MEYKENIMESREGEEVLAFQKDLSGERKFVRINGEIYFIDQEGNREKSSPGAMEAAVEKYHYQLPSTHNGKNQES